MLKLQFVSFGQPLLYQLPLQNHQHFGSLKNGGFLIAEKSPLPVLLYMTITI